MRKITTMLSELFQLQGSNCPLMTIRIPFFVVWANTQVSKERSESEKLYTDKMITNVLFNRL